MTSCTRAAPRVFWIQLYLNKNDTHARVFTGRLPKWFGERPGKKATDPETPEEEELKKNEEDELEPFGLDDEEAEEEVNQ